MRQANPIAPQLPITAVHAWLLYTVFNALTDDNNTEHSTQWATNGLSVLGTLMLAQMFNHVFLQKDILVEPRAHQGLAAITFIPTAILTSIISWNTPANIPAALLSAQAIAALHQEIYCSLAEIKQNKSLRKLGPPYV